MVVHLFLLKHDNFKRASAQFPSFRTYVKIAVRVRANSFDVFVLKHLVFRGVFYPLKAFVFVFYKNVAFHSSMIAAAAFFFKCLEV